MLYESMAHNDWGGVMTDMDVEGCQTNLMLLEHEANKHKDVGIIGPVGDLQSGHLFVGQFTSYLYILLGD